MSISYMVTTNKNDILHALFDACARSFDMGILLLDGSWRTAPVIIDIYLRLHFTFLTCDPPMTRYRDVLVWLHGEDIGMSYSCDGHLRE